MAASGVTDELASLEQARARLEAALAGDEHASSCDIHLAGRR